MQVKKIAGRPVVMKSSGSNWKFTLLLNFKALQQTESHPFLLLLFQTLQRWFFWDWHTLRRGAISLPLGTVCMCLVCKIPLALSFQYKMPKLMNWDAEVAKAAPAIPHPKPNIKNMSRPRFTKFDKIDARSGVLHAKITCQYMLHNWTLIKSSTRVSNGRYDANLWMTCLFSNLVERNMAFITTNLEGSLWNLLIIKPSAKQSGYTFTSMRLQFSKAGSITPFSAW